MIISPKVAIDKGYLTSPDIPFDLKEQLQPNGLDIRIKSVSVVHQYKTLYLPGQKPKHIEKLIVDGYFQLQPHYFYNVDCYEIANIPENIVACIYGRSTLNRNGVIARSSLYDSGYNNVVGLSILPFCHFHVKPGERIAQIVFYEADSIFTYKGQYQNSRKPVEFKTV